MRTPLLIAALALVATACGGSGPSAGGSAPSDGSSASTAPGDEVRRCSSFDVDCEERLAPDTVELRGIQFKPGTIEVATGTTVTFDNLDPVAHTVTAGTPDAPNPGAFDVSLDADESTSIVFDRPGTVSYFCAIHPGSMQATIVVT